MDMPPSRYKVVEEGRRLIVVDRQTGEPLKHQIHSKPHRRDQRYGLESLKREERPKPRPGRAGAGVGADRVFTTQSWYDNSAPRALVLTDNALAGLIAGGAILMTVATIAFFVLGFFALFVLVFLTFQKGPRTAFRTAATTLLDSLPQA